MNSNNNSEDIVNYYPFTEVPERIKRSITKLEFDSGRYYTFINDYDFYQHDTVTGKDTLIYDGYYVDNPDEHDKNRTVDDVFAVNDTIYFNIVNPSGNVSFIGSGAYNITENQLTTYENKISALLYWDGYIYGRKNVDDSLFRFKPASPDAIETVDPEFFSSSTILFAPSGRFIVKINYNDTINTSTITIYNTADYSVFKSYTYNDPSSFIYLGRISDKYLYLSVESTVFDNKAYVISLP